MSISPTDGRRSAPHSSSRALSRNPSSAHGPRKPSPAQPRRRQIGGAATGSPPAPAAEAPLSVPGPVTSSAGDSRDTTDFVTGSGMPDGKRDSYDDNIGAVSQHHTTGCGGLSSEFRSDMLGPNGKRSGTSNPGHSDHHTAGSSVLHGSATQSAIRRSQIGNANHLLNFHYDPIPRPQPRNPPPRRQRKIKPYNKDLFLQANYKFVVLNTGDYQTESMDPDRMLQWEDIICVRYSTPYPVHCPICLETPLCPQITSCGHIYCFPCILRYLLMGEEDHKGEYWKKCPLCFMMICTKDLYTIYINSVKQFHVGDRVYFALLSRAKNSLVPSLKNQQEGDVLPESDNDLCDSFSKFILTSDVELSVKEAKLDLSNWLCKAEAGQVDDLENLPYVCAALEQLEERMRRWTEHWIVSGSPPLGHHASPNNKLKEKDSLTKSAGSDSSKIAESAKVDTWDSTVETLQAAQKHDSIESGRISAECPLSSICAVPQSHKISDQELSSQDEDSGMQRNSMERDSYTFYQAIDGQHLILHPLNMKCLLHHYGGYDLLPSRINGVILELETVTQSEALRRRYRYLSHLSLTTTFQLCEIDMSDILPPSSLTLFMDEIKKREKQRKRLARKEQKGKVRAEDSTVQMMPMPFDQRHSSHEDATFSLDDFEALGSSVPSSSPPTISGRKLFSSVTRLGFAAAHDSPSLRAGESAESSASIEPMGETSSIQATRTPATLSFASVISAAKNEGSPEMQKSGGFVKKGKKPTRVLLSTAGGRRY